jgi:hypothetical protein
VDLDVEDTILIMVHKRIRKRESYDIDSVEIMDAIRKNGYSMEKKEVMDGLARLKSASYIRAYEELDKGRVKRYWGIEITPEGAMRAIDLLNQFRSGN